MSKRFGLFVCLGAGLISTGCATVHAQTISIGTLREAAPRLDRGESATVLDTHGEEVSIEPSQAVAGVVTYEHGTVALPSAVQTLHQLLHFCDGVADEACALRRVGFVELTHERHGWDGSTIAGIAYAVGGASLVGVAGACAAGEIGCEDLRAGERAAIVVSATMVPLVVTLVALCSHKGSCFGSAH